MKTMYSGYELSILERSIFMKQFSPQMGQGEVPCVPHSSFGNPPLMVAHHQNTVRDIFHPVMAFIH